MTAQLATMSGEMGGTTDERRHIFSRGVPLSRERSRPSVRLLTHRPERPDGGDERLTRRLFDEAGLDFSLYRTSALQRRNGACHRVIGADDTDAALRRLDRRPELVPQALDAVLLGVTAFFRDAEVFRHLERQVLPHVLLCTERPRVWSAACSSGEELHSVAIMLHAAGELRRCQLLGTDVRASALRTAAAGLYAEPVRRPAGTVRDPRLPGGPLVRMPPAVTQHIAWKQADLLRTVESGPWDVILWRNMAIYLTTEAVTDVWTRLAAELRPGGWIISGKAERAPGHLGLQRVAPSIYRKPHFVA